ncbi:MAG TPA: phosphoribosyl-AMP cyclohydrolase [Thermomicrobiales bacterium]|nr:phosphoribosyl-AMP cyclohydrolase [Thermomicrobiales bacterium]
MSNVPVNFDAAGLVPVVVQDNTTDQVLMMAFMNREAFELTRSTGEVHFWSRSRAKLWHKGETSGHVQHVRSIAVNCNADSLLIRVDQVGACCHTGHETCYFRQLNDDGALVATSEPLFDPDVVYRQVAASDDLHIWVGAYGWLQANDLREISGTSRLLRTSTIEYLAGRVADELTELIGVVRGTHVHTTPTEDIVLEGGQVLYWMTLAALRSGADRSELAADASRGSQESSRRTGSDLTSALTALARDWREANTADVGTLVEVTVALVCQAAMELNVPFRALIAKDLADLRSRPYLNPYFSGALA